MSVVRKLKNNLQRLFFLEDFGADFDCVLDQSFSGGRNRDHQLFLPSIEPAVISAFMPSPFRRDAAPFIIPDGSGVAVGTDHVSG